MEKEKTIKFTAREWEMYQAGVQHGTGVGMEMMATQLSASLNQSVAVAREQVAEANDDKEAEKSLHALEVWVGGFKPWIDVTLQKARESKDVAAASVETIGPAPTNLRKQFVSAILGAVDGFKKG